MLQIALRLAAGQVHHRPAVCASWQKKVITPSRREEFTPPPSPTNRTQPASLTGWVHQGQEGGGSGWGQLKTPRLQPRQSLLLVGWGGVRGARWMMNDVRHRGRFLDDYGTGGGQKETHTSGTAFNNMKNTNSVA